MVVRPLALSSFLFLLVACSGSSKPNPDGGDAHPDMALDMVPTEAGPPDSSSSDGDTSDGGTSDGGPPDGDGGPGDASDGGPVSCDQAAHDPVLGTARLGAAYRVVDSAILPVTSWLPVAAVDEALPDGGTGLVVYGYAGDGFVHRLGTWPQLAAPDAANVAFDAVSSDDRKLQVLITPLLSTTHGQLLAGYRTVRSVGFVTGGVSLVDTARPAAGTRWLAAPGVEGTLGLGSFFLVGGNGLGAAGSAPGVYGVNVDDATLHPGLVAKYPTIASDAVRPGLMAVTTNGVVVMGYYLDGAARHSLRLPEPSSVTAALSGGAAIDLAAAPELVQADDVANLASLGEGVAVLRTNQVQGILPALGRLEHYALSRPGGDAGTAVGAPVTMLSASDDGCTVVSQLVPVTGGLTVIVGLWDRNGQRLVRLAAR